MKRFQFLVSSNIHKARKENSTKERKVSNTNLSNARQERINLYFHVYVDSSGATVQVQIIVLCGPNGWDFPFHCIRSYDTYSKTLI